MARIRSIKPEVASDAKLARVSRGTRYHFVLLWTVADDAGYFRAAPRQLLGQLYPHDRDLGESDVDRMTSELAAEGFVVIVQTSDGPIGYVVNWLKHQRIDRPSKSHLRECCANGSRVSHETPLQGVLSPESLVLSPDLKATTKTVRAKPDTSWLSPICDVYERHYGAGSFNYGMAGRTLKRLHEAGHHEEEIALRLGRYLDGLDDVKYLSLAKFAQSFAAFASNAPRRNGGKVSIGEQTYRNAMEAVPDDPT